MSLGIKLHVSTLIRANYLAPQNVKCSRCLLFAYAVVHSVHWEGIMYIIIVEEEIHGSLTSLVPSLWRNDERACIAGGGAWSIATHGTHAAHLRGKQNKTKINTCLAQSR